MEKKYYGIFKVCVDTRHNDFAARKLQLFTQRIEEPENPWFVKANEVFEQRTGNAIASKLFTLRMIEKNEDKFRHCFRFRTKYFVHEVDESGWLKLSKAEKKAAEEKLAICKPVEEDSKKRQEVLQTV